MKDTLFPVGTRVRLANGAKFYGIWPEAMVVAVGSEPGLSQHRFLAVNHNGRRRPLEAPYLATRLAAA